MLGRLRLRDRADEARRFPIAVLSFDRPDYLAAVLDSLLPQITPDWNIALFQDGAVNPYSGATRGDPHRIAQCIEFFRRAAPWGSVFESPENLGIAFNYERAERWAFEEAKADCALLLEDDLVLSQNYLNVIGQLLAYARLDDRIAYVSAYGDLWASRWRQIWRGSDLIQMHENWGAALTRKAWLAERPFRAAYLELVQGIDYRDRDNAAIVDFYRQRGWNCRYTSQDAARWIATLERGAVRVTTATCHARYIGERGVHCSPEQYRESGFDKTVMYRGAAPRIRRPKDSDIAAWLAEEKLRFTGDAKAFYPGH